ncbi:hypothetical protein LXA43DRAFT_1092308 [Ganoderma leucocontextum]|nr:hypothetical protein LXA43DRAFT_1092308 [Ganoderma leucocontextum]
MSRVPHELSDYIIDFLYDDPQSLRACASTCNAWAPASRFHLFRTVSLNSANSTTAFRRLLDSSPNLGLYVHDLAVAKLTHVVTISLPDEALEELRPAQNTLPSILAHSPNLQTLSLSHADLKCFVDIRMLAHPTVSSLTVSYCQFADLADVADLVSSFPSLASLSMSGLTWKDEARTPTPARLPSLRSLVLGRDMDSEKLFEWLEAALSARCASERDADLVGAFLKLAGPSLHDLSLDWSLTGDKTVVLPDSMSLGECAALKHLSLEFPVHFSAHLPWVTSFLATLGGTSLRSISCEIRLLGNIDALDWEHLNKILSSEAYSSLEALKYDVNVWPGVHKDFAEVEGLVRARLAAFDKKGMVHISKA